MKTIKLELTPDEIQILAQALDTHVRQHGLQVATNAVVVCQKLQAASLAKPEPVAEATPQVNLQVVNVDDPKMVPSAIESAESSST